MKAMKPRSIGCFIIVMLFVILPLRVFAWEPDAYFRIWIDPAQIPEGTVYVDMLLRIPETDPGYTAFHEDNGQLYGISADSQIVSYELDGFRSYTFHVVDAVGEIRPWFQYDFSVSREVYDRHKPLLEEFEDHCFVFRDGESRQYTLTVYRGSDLERRLNEIAETLDVSLERDRKTVYTKYNSNNDIWYERQSEFDYWYCRDTYREAKLAYLDGEGNVLAVSNAVSIAPLFREGQLHLRLAGTVLSCEPTSGPPYYLLALVPVAAIGVAVVMAGKWVLRKVIRK